MTEPDLRVANTRLQSGGEVNPYTARHMGLFVVGRLAAQHGLVVRLRSTIAGEQNSGTTAGVFVRSELLVETGAPDQFGGSEYGTPADAHAGIVTALALDEDHDYSDYSDYSDHLDEPGQESPQRPLRGACRVAATALSRRQRNLRHPGLAGQLAAEQPEEEEAEWPAEDLWPADSMPPQTAEPAHWAAAGGPGARGRPPPHRHVGVLRLARTAASNGVPTPAPVAEPRRSHPRARAPRRPKQPHRESARHASHEPSPTAGADDAIYQKMLSEWLVDPTDMARSADLNWESVWDHGWSAAAAAEDAPVAEHTEAGLPVRQPGARLVPGAVDSPDPDMPRSGVATGSTAVRTEATKPTTR